MAQQPAMPTPDRARAVVAELGLAVTGMVLGVAVLFVLRALGLWPATARGIGLISGPTITGIAALFYLWAHTRLDAGQPLLSPITRVGRGHAVLVALVATAVAIGGSMVLGVVLELLGAPVAEQQTIVEIVADWHAGTDRTTMIVLGVSAVVLAPIAEECLFRGLLFARLREASGRPIAYVVSAIGFAAIHGNPAGLPIYLWLGVVFALSLERSGRLAAPIAVHMGNNAFAFAVLLLGQ